MTELLSGQETSPTEKIDIPDLEDGDYYGTSESYVKEIRLRAERERNRTSSRARDLGGTTLRATDAGDPYSASGVTGGWNRNTWDK